MQHRERRVVVSGVGSFLPNDPVPTSRIDEVLGPLEAAPEKVKEFARRFARKFADRSGVEYRHFAVDPKTGRLTHTVASLAEEACRRALAAAETPPEDVDLLLVSTPLYDQICPPTSAILQEKLGVGDCVEMEVHANCSGLFKCLQIASDALRLGRYRTALVAYPQLSSAYLRSAYYKQSKVTRTQAALRYILTDGAGALVLRGIDAEDGDPLPAELLGIYVESVGWQRPPAMTLGAGIADLVSHDDFAGIYEQGAHHLDQDLVTVGREAPEFLFAAVRRHLEASGLEPAEVTRMVVSVPSVQQYQSNLERFQAYLTSWRPAREFPYRRSGYCGGAAVLVRLDELIRSGQIERGEVLLVHAIESSKWMSGGFTMRW